MSWSDGYNYCLLQRGNGFYEDSEDSQSSQETDSSQGSQETDSSQEVTEHLNPWSRILDEAQEHHEIQLNKDLKIPRFRVRIRVGLPVPVRDCTGN